MHNVYMSDKCHNICQINATDKRNEKSWWRSEASGPSAFFALRWTPGPWPNVHQMIRLPGVPFPQVSSRLTLPGSNSICSVRPNTWRIPPSPSCPLLSFPCRSNIWYKLLICIFNICLLQLECKFQEGRALCFVQGYNSKPWIVPDKK